MLNFKIYSFGQFRAVSGAQNLGFVPGISGMPGILPETSMPETLPTLVGIHYSYVQVDNMDDRQNFVN